MDQIENIKKEIWAMNNRNATKKKIENLANPNMLINGDFSINQRGNSGSSSTIGYTLADHWFLDFGTYGFKNRGCVLNASTKIKQAVENFAYNGEYLTLSIKVDDNIISGSTLISYTKGTAKNINLFTKNNIVGDVYYDGNNVWVVLENTGSAVEISYIKLELGQYATPYIYRTYQQELDDCQRYFVRIRPSVGYAAFTQGAVCYMDNNQHHCHCCLPKPKMRISPTLNTSGKFHFLTAANYITVSSIGLAGATDFNVVLDVVLPTGAKATLGHAGTLRAGDDSNAYIDLDAEIYM